ncbi:MAG: ABC transporter ATP-binding protein [Deltaproteobacteria bacterium]
MGAMRNPLRRPGFWIAVAVVVAIAVVVGVRSRGPAVHTTRAVRQDLEQHVVASGRVRVPSRVQIAAQTSGPSGSGKSTLLNIIGLLGRPSSGRIVLSGHDTTVNSPCSSVIDTPSRARVRATNLSGGQQQRVAIARALVRRPPLVLADEPTGNLDTAASDEVFALMRELNRELGTTVLVVTHDPRIAAGCDRTIELLDGRVRGSPPPPTQV